MTRLYSLFRVVLRAAIRGGAVSLLLVACVGGGGGGGSGAADGPAAPVLSRVSLDDMPARVVAWFPIPIRDAPEVRNIRWPIPEYGWGTFVLFVVPILQHYNLQRVMLHNPFGRLSGEPYQFDQYLEAQTTSGLELATSTFVDDWLNNFLGASLGNNAEVIAYIGSPRLDPESQDLLNAGREDDFFARAWQAVDPLLQAGMSIGYDASAAADRDSATYRFAEMLRERGTKVYAEANPTVDKSWWFDYPVIVRDDTWRARLDNPAYADHDELQGEVIRIVRVDRSWVDSHGPAEWPAAMCRVIAEGDTLAVPDVLLRQSTSRNLQDLVDCANALVADAQA